MTWNAHIGWVSPFCARNWADVKIVYFKSTRLYSKVHSGKSWYDNDGQVILVPGALDSIPNLQRAMDTYRRFSNVLAQTKCSFKEIIIIVKNSTESTFLETIHIVMLLDFIQRICMAIDISFLRICNQSDSGTPGDVQAQSSSRLSQTQHCYL